VDIALDQLESIIKEISGTVLCWWLIPDTFRFTWPADTRTDVVADVMADSYPSLGIVTPISAELLDVNGVRICNLQIVRRHVYESVPDKDRNGVPQMLYFDRRNDASKVSIYPVPDSTTEYQIDLLAQTYSGSILGNQTQTDQSGNLSTQFGPEWDKFLDYQLSANIGDGPCARVSLQYIKNWQETAATSRGLLEAFANREKKSTVSRTKRWGS